VNTAEIVAAAIAILAAALLAGRAMRSAYRASAGTALAPRPQEAAETPAAPPDAEANTGEFAARMGHELRTPLNSVIGFSSVLLKNPRGNLSTQQLLYLSRIRDNGVHLLALVDHLLDASSQGSGPPRVRLGPVSVERLVRGALQEIASEAVIDHVTIEAEIPSDILPLTTDEHRFELALRSLVRGAYPLAGEGSMTVRVAAPGGRPVRIDVDVTGPATTRDTGSGSAVVAPAELTLATSLYHLLGYPVTTGQSAANGATFSVMLDHPAPAIGPGPAGAAAALPAIP
jgi:signal transduction histidine kinase